MSRAVHVLTGIQTGDSGYVFAAGTLALDRRGERYSVVTTRPTRMPTGQRMRPTIAFLTIDELEAFATAALADIAARRAGAPIAAGA